MQRRSDELTASHKKKSNNDQHPSCDAASLNGPCRTSRSLPCLGPSGKVGILASDVGVGRLHGKSRVEREGVSCRVSQVNHANIIHDHIPLFYTTVYTAIVMANTDFGRRCRQSKVRISKVVLEGKREEGIGLHTICLILLL